MDETHRETREKLWTLVDKIGVGMLTTFDQAVLRSRPMYAHVDQSEGVLWFFVDATDHKTTEIQQNPLINLSFVDRDEGIYVSLSGKAQVVDDRSIAKAQWTPSESAWYPKGLEDENLRLLRIEVTQAEYWDRETATMKHLWEMAKAMVSEETPKDLGENRKVDFSSNP